MPPDNLHAAYEQLTAAFEQHEDCTRSEQDRKTTADCDQRLAQYRAALDADADSTTAATWMSEVAAEVSDAMPQPRVLSKTIVSTSTSSSGTAVRQYICPTG